MVASINGDTPSSLDGFFHGKSQPKMDDLGVPSILRNLHMAMKKTEQNGTRMVPKNMGLMDGSWFRNPVLYSAVHPVFSTLVIVIHYLILIL